MLTICYSVLTWLQSRQRQEILGWINEICVENKVSLVFTKSRLHLVPTNITITATGPDATPKGGSNNLSLSTSANHSHSHSHSAASGSGRPLHADYGQYEPYDRTRQKPSAQVSNLCYNYNNIKRTKLIWEEDESRVLALFPLQVVELQHWCAFIGTEIHVQNPGTLLSPSHCDNNTRSDGGGDGYPENLDSCDAGESKLTRFYILLEAEPGFTSSKDAYRKFSQFGHITAWKCGYELALILRSDIDQLIELMHIFRLGQIVLEGGWRVHRLTTVTVQGTVGTLIAKSDIHTDQTSFTPAELRRLAAGIYDCGESPVSISQDTSKLELSKICSDTDCTSAGVRPLDTEEEEDSLKISELPNWYERSPKKRSIATIHYCEKPAAARRKLSLSSLSQRSKSSSLASLLFCSKSISTEEDRRTSGASSALNSPAQTPDKENRYFTKSRARKSSGPSRQLSSADSLLSTPDRHASHGHLVMPGSSTTVCGLSTIKSMSATTLVPQSPIRSGLSVKSPSRLGKPPNILILSEDSKKRTDLANILKSMLANDRYTIYEIRWEQISVGGWSDQTALLVVAGKIPDPSAVPHLLQFLGDGGRLFAWCCETPPFGLPISDTANDNIVKAVTYAASQTQPLHLSGATWGPQSKQDNTSLPPTFQRIIETNDSEGDARPLTASTFAKRKDTGDVVIIQLDGGVMGGKAILSQVLFEKTMTEDSSLGLLSLILSQNLGLDCTRIKIPEYTDGYLLGDHRVISEFMSNFPATIEQSGLTLEFVPKEMVKYSKPSHDRLPIHYLQCPPNFSTLSYFENLKTRNLGRLAIYADVLTSTNDVLTGHSLRDGLVVIARRQTSARGRGKNIWLSPEGCVPFSFQLFLDLNSGIGRRISLVQHIAALAIVQSVPSHKEINLRVKWPNDVYVGDKKVAGIIVESTLQGKSCVITIGIGINVCNTNPTTCLNAVLEKPLTFEVLVARVLTEFESLLDSVDAGNVDAFLESYVENWIHNSKDEVNVEVSEGKFATCHLVGLDEYGFLRVEEIGSGHIFSVRPDGNSFDITNRLIAIKQ